MKKKIIALISTMALTIVSSVAVLADSQIGTPTYRGVDVVCSSTCEFNWCEEDKALAMTNWDGITQHYVETYLFSCEDIDEVYKCQDYARGTKRAWASCQEDGVWTFKSMHYVIDKVDNVKKSMRIYKDW